MWRPLKNIHVFILLFTDRISGGKFERLLKTKDTQEKPGEDQVNTGEEDASPDDKETAPDDQDENPVDECKIKDPEEIAKKRFEWNDFSVIKLIQFSFPSWLKDQIYKDALPQF